MFRFPAALLPAALLLAAAAPDDTSRPEQVVVVAPTPLLGTGVRRDRIPAAVQTLTEEAIARRGEPDVLGALSAEANGVNLDSASGNPHQPTLYYKGFAVSPLQGTAQGLAVYLDGVRFNQAFGDTVNWDLIPDDAISRLTLVGANPAFGLNALGGAINVGLKSGFTEQGAEASLSGGSFGQIDADASYGAATDTESLFAAGSIRHADGWRDLQSSDIQSAYADYGRKRDRSELHARLLLANSVLNGPGTAPIELIDAAPEAQFTAPNLIANRYLQGALTARTTFGDGWELQAQAYYSYFLQRVENGNATDIAACDTRPALLCGADSAPVTGRAGDPLLARRGDGPYSTLDQQTTNTNGFGTIGQIANTGTLLGRANHFAIGTAFDGARTTFTALSEVGGLSPLTREFLGPGQVLNTADSSPVRVKIPSLAAGVFATDTVDLTPEISLTASARFNFVETDLHDQNGGDLSGNHAYARFNPAIGATWRARPWLALYAGYAETNRAPTPAELSCAGPENACSLANFFVGDPSLRQVVARTIEAGARGRFKLPGAISADYDLGLFHTNVDDDIAFINAPALGRAYFANIGGTSRQGLNARIALTAARWSFSAAYTYTDATYRAAFTEAAGENPGADGLGDITIRPGAALPGIPRAIVKLGAAFETTPRTTLGLDAVIQSGQYLFGDEANLTPRLPGYTVLTLWGNWRVTDHLELFARVQNLTDARYYTYGTFGPTSSVFLAEAPNATNPRSYSLAAPIGGFAGIKLTY